MTSFSNILSSIRDTIKRFPSAILCAVVMTFLFLYLIEKPNDRILEVNLRHGLMALYLGMLSFIALVVFVERYSIRFISILILHLIVLLLVVLYFLSLNEINITSDWIKFAVLVLAAHLSVSFAPYIVNREVNGFWHYNRILFLRFLTAFIYSAVLFAGLALAMLAIDNLFDVKVPDTAYQRLWIITALLFNTVFFLGGVPYNVSSLNMVKEYPTPLKLFTQYVLLPLVIVYLVILYVYESKIIITGIWPMGWVSYLVVGFSIVGIFSILLIWPWRSSTESKWIAKFSKFFFIAILPLIVMLALAIYKRCSAYGITENRYFIILLTIWLIWNTIYFLGSSIKNIKMIPLSLFFACLISLYGPQSAFSISEKSQFNRLKNYLSNAGRLKNEKAVFSAKKIELSDAKEIVSILDYLLDTHGIKSIQPLFDKNLDTILVAKDLKSYFSKTKVVSDLIGIDYDKTLGYSNVNLEDGFVVANYSSLTEESFEIAGYDYFQDFNLYTDNVTSENFEKVVNNYKIDYSYSNGSWDIVMNIDSLGTAKINLEKLFVELNNYKYTQYAIPTEKMKVKFTSASFDGVLIIKSINAEVNLEENKLRLKFINGYLLFKFKSNLSQ
jgi:hypothetical protein